MLYHLLSAKGKCVSTPVPGGTLSGTKERNHMRKNSIKNTRINMEVQRELSEIIRTQVKDPALKGVMVTVVSAEVTPDLKYCKAYVSILGSEERVRDAYEGLTRAVGFIRKELAERVNLRNTPELKFILDQSIEYGVHMSKLIDDVTAAMKSEEDHGGQDDEPEEEDT